MNIKTFMAAAVIALTAACSPAEDAEVAEVTVTETAAEGPAAEATEAAAETPAEGAVADPATGEAVK